MIPTQIKNRWIKIMMTSDLIII